MNVLVDTNVYIDFLGRKEPFYSDAIKVAAAGYFGDVKLWVPAHSLLGAFCVLRKYLPVNALQQAIEKSCQVFTPVDLSVQDILRAARLDWPDLEDCTVSLAAEKAKADYLITRDAKGFARSAVPAISPEDWLAMMREKGGFAYDQVEL